MTKYLLLYRADQDAAAQMAQATPEQQQAGMQAWMAWFEKVGPAVVDAGSPLAGVGGADPSVGGYSVLTAESTDALQDLLEGHPHREVGGTIDVHEFLPMPGM
jgi:hypothetical protein